MIKARISIPTLQSISVGLKSSRYLSRPFRDQVHEVLDLCLLLDLNPTQREQLDFLKLVFKESTATRRHISQEIRSAAQQLIQQLLDFLSSVETGTEPAASASDVDKVVEDFEALQLGDLATQSLSLQDQAVFQQFFIRGELNDDISSFMKTNHFSVVAHYDDFSLDVYGFLSADSFFDTLSDHLHLSKIQLQKFFVYKRDSPPSVVRQLKAGFQADRPLIQELVDSTLFSLPQGGITGTIGGFVEATFRFLPAFASAPRGHHFSSLVSHVLLGPPILPGRHTFSVTAGHCVEQIPNTETEFVCFKQYGRYALDIAFLPLDQVKLAGVPLNNTLFPAHTLLWGKVVQPHGSDRKWCSGMRAVKLGNVSDLTVGYLKSTKTDTTDGRVISVVNSLFGQSGDSGSVIYLEEGNCLHPLSVHDGFQTVSSSPPGHFEAGLIGFDLLIIISRFSPE